MDLNEKYFNSFSLKNKKYYRLNCSKDNIITDEVMSEFFEDKPESNQLIFFESLKSLLMRSYEYRSNYLQNFDILQYIYDKINLMDNIFDEENDYTMLTISFILMELFRLKVYVFEDLLVEHRPIYHFVDQIFKNIEPNRELVLCNIHRFCLNEFYYNHKLSYRFFKIAVKCDRILTDKRAQKICLDFLFDFVHYCNNFEPKLIRRISRCVYSILEADKTPLIPRALNLYSIFIERFNDQNIIFYKHFYGLLSAQLNKNNLKIVASALNLLKTSLSLDNININMVLKNFPISAIYVNIGDQMSEEVSVLSLHILKILSEMSNESLHFLLNTNVLDIIAQYYGDSYKRKTLFSDIVISMIKNLKPDMLLRFFTIPIVKDIVNDIILIKSEVKLFLEVLISVFTNFSDDILRNFVQLLYECNILEHIKDLANHKNGAISDTASKLESIIMEHELRTKS